MVLRLVHVCNLSFMPSRVSWRLIDSPPPIWVCVYLHVSTSVSCQPPAIGVTGFGYTRPVALDQGTDMLCTWMERDCPASGTEAGLGLKSKLLQVRHVVMAWQCPPRILNGGYDVASHIQALWNVNRPPWFRSS